MVTISTDRHIRKWDLDFNRQESISEKFMMGDITAVDWSNDNSCLCVADDAGVIYLID